MDAEREGLANTDRLDSVQSVSAYLWYLLRSGGLYVFLALVTLGIITVGFSRFAGYKDWASSLFINVISTWVNFVIIGWFLDRLQDKKRNETLRQTLALIFSGTDTNIYSSLSESSRQLIVKKTLVASLGPQYGERVYSEIVAGYLARENDYRENYRYVVTCLERAPPRRVSENAQLLSINSRLLEQAKYYLWISQTIEFTRHGFKADRESNNIIFLFALNEDSLNEFLSDDTLFFRELLQLDTSTLALLLDLKDQELTEFVRNTLRFRGKRLDARSLPADQSPDLPYLVQWGETYAGKKYIRISIDNPSRRLEGSGCQISFEMPQIRSACCFFVSLPKPVKSGATITFSRNTLMTQLQPLVFIDHEAYRQSQIPDGSDDPQSIHIETRKWVFPRGGLTFIWRYQEDHELL